MENYLTWQERTMRIGRDPRLKIDTARVISTNIFGAEPAQPDSIADKLTAPFKPFLIFQDDDIKAIVDLSFTGQKTSKSSVAEEYIRQAYEIMNKYGIEAEPSAAAGLALYLKRYDRDLIQEDKKVLIVNTGKGLASSEPLKL